MAPLLDTEHTVWQALGRPPGYRPHGLDLDRHVAPWLDDVAAAGLGVRAVLGLGPGALFADVIAAGVARRQRATPAVLQPGPATTLAESIPEQCRRLVASVSGPRRPLDSGALRSAAGLTQEVLNLTAFRLSGRAGAEWGGTGRGGTGRRGTGEGGTGHGGGQLPSGRGE
ncbi:hypothetical protein OG802_00875 [Streptomyces sp. NBC_00704]|uniref:hypothetical protein n=1 Tax=Streptomyces sp. NBC_00704 TaxID=2975809 RepID=UPI002E3112D3|nr:hypothetical protein [Streptomyces sp. NBC_00704]